MMSNPNLITLEQKFDGYFKQMLTEIGNNPEIFFDAVFGYFYRHKPEMLSCMTDTAEKSFKKWQGMLQSADKSKDPDLSMTTPNSDKVSFSNLHPPWPVSAPSSPLGPDQHEPTGSSADGSLVCSEIPHNESKTQRDQAINRKAVVPNDHYAWTQTYEDIDLRINISDNIKKSNQVKVELTSTKLKVEEQYKESQWVMSFCGHFAHPIDNTGSFWTLTPGDSIMFTLSKKEELIWDRLLKEDPAMNMQNAVFERDYYSLPEEDRSKIQEIVFNESQKRAGKPTSDVLKMESMLKEAWDAEGSPFKGKPFDPSSVNILNSFS